MRSVTNQQITPWMKVTGIEVKQKQKWKDWKHLSQLGHRGCPLKCI